MSKLSPEELCHVYQDKETARCGGDRRLFPRCKPCGKYCTCVEMKTDDRGVVHRRVCCQCALRPSNLWSYQLKRTMCAHAPSYSEIPKIVEKMWKTVTVTSRPADETMALVAASKDLSLHDVSSSALKVQSAPAWGVWKEEESWEEPTTETKVNIEKDDVLEPSSASASVAWKEEEESWEETKPENRVNIQSEDDALEPSSAPASGVWKQVKEESWDETTTETKTNAHGSLAATSTESEVLKCKMSSQETTKISIINDAAPGPSIVTPRPKLSTVFIVDYQSFRDNDNQDIVKELAAIRLSDDSPAKTKLWTTVQPPFVKEKLNGIRLQQYRYVSECLHGLRWEEGIMTEDDAFRLLRLAVSAAEEEENNEIVIFVKGLEKEKFISRKVSQARVIDYGGPSLKRMQTPFDTPFCPAHSNMPKGLTCALENCFKIAAHYISSTTAALR